MAVNPELVNVLPIASPTSARFRPTTPLASLVLELLSFAPFQTSTPSIPAQPLAVVSAAQPLTSIFVALEAFCFLRGASMRPRIVLGPWPSGPESHDPCN